MHKHGPVFAEPEHATIGKATDVARRLTSHRMKHLTNIRRTRLRWALSQAELAALADTTQSGISRLETEGTADLALAFRLQAIFGTSPRALFPHLYRAAEDRVMANAARLDRALGQRTDHAASVKRRLLKAMVHRAQPNASRP